MALLYLTQQGTKLHKDYGRFVVQLPDTDPVKVPIKEVEHVCLFGNIQLSTSAISTCLYHHIPVVFLSQTGSYKGHLWSAEDSQQQTQALQYDRFSHPQFQWAMAQAIVRGKLWNARQLLPKLNRRHQLETVAAAAQGINRDRRAATKLTLETDSLNSLRGYEGTAAARYFLALGQLLKHPDFTLTHRTRRPPTDPVNSLLSFGYTLLFNNVLSLILAEGLNPYLGNLHGSEKKTFLAFDLMEEFRSPVVDSLVLTLINRRLFLPTDFTWPNSDGGVYLDDSARRLFIQKVETRLGEAISHPDVEATVSYRRAIQLQIKRYKRSLLDGEDYEPFLRAT
jgi:CRISPR-associated protein Cas1